MGKSTILLAIGLFTSIIILAQEKKQIEILSSEDIVIENTNYSTFRGTIEVPEDYKSLNSRKFNYLYLL